MRRLRKLTVALAGGGLLWAAPLSASAAAPDMYVIIGSIVKETIPADPPRKLPVREVWKVDVSVGNAGNVQPNASVYTFFRAGTASGPVCQELGLPDIQGKLTPGAAFKAFRFQVTYPSRPPTQLELQKRHVVQYMLEAEVRYLNYECQQGINDNYCANNLQRVTLGFPTGGTPGCVKLVQ